MYHIFFSCLTTDSNNSAPLWIQSIYSWRLFWNMLIKEIFLYLLVKWVATSFDLVLKKFNNACSSSLKNYHQIILQTTNDFKINFPFILLLVYNLILSFWTTLFLNLLNQYLSIHLSNFTRWLELSVLCFVVLYPCVSPTKAADDAVFQHLAWLEIWC